MGGQVRYTPKLSALAATNSDDRRATPHRLYQKLESREEETPMTYDELKDAIKEAMKAKDKPRLSILRQVHGEIKNIEVNERRDITDADVDAMLKRLIKQTKEICRGR